MIDSELLSITIAQELGPSMRLDKALILSCADYSRNYLQQLIEDGQVSVNKKIAGKVSVQVKPGDEIQIVIKQKTTQTAPAAVDFEVLFEHKDFLIINKPAGLMVHPAPASPNDLSLVNGLLYKYPEITACGDQVRPGIVHRIDKNTSGLILVARNPRAEKTFSALFKERKMNKEYIALVHGHTPQQGTITKPIGRSFKERHKMSIGGIAARDAQTFYKLVAYIDDYSLLRVKIITGRTHQIRVHLQSEGHPIVGDETYGTSSKLIKRQALHAWAMSFEYENKIYSFKAPLAGDIQNALVSLYDLFDFNLTISSSPIDW